MGAFLTFFIASAKIIALPPLVLKGVFVLIDRHPQLLPTSFSNTYIRVFLQILSVPLFFFGREAWRKWRGARNAKMMGGVPIPRAKGKWPGNIDILVRLVRSVKTRYAAAVYNELLQEHSTNVLNLRVLWTDLILTVDEGHVKYILATGFNQYEKGQQQRERQEDFFGTGIFNVNGEEWKAHRAMTRPFFNKERISDFETFHKYTTKTCAILSRIASSSVPVVDMQDLYARFTLDAASEFLFGKEMDTLGVTLPVPGKAKMAPKGSATEDEFGSFAQAFERAQIAGSARLARQRIWPLFELFGNAMKQPMVIVHDFLNPLVQNALQQNAQREKGEEALTLLQELAASTDDQVIIRDELLNIMLAGRDTTAGLLSFCTYLLALHPKVADRLREEINQHCAGGEPTYQTIRDMKYLRAVLNETLRLFPPVPINIRSSKSKGTLLPSGAPGKPNYYLPPRTDVLYSALLLQRRKDLWGPDADEFDPDRWADPAKVAIYSSQFHFVPFNAGPRICTGQNFAYNEASHILCSIIPRFNFSMAPEYQPEGSLPPSDWANRTGRERIEQICPLNSTTMFVKGGLWMKVTPII